MVAVDVANQGSPHGAVPLTVKFIGFTLVGICCDNRRQLPKAIRGCCRLFEPFVWFYYLAERFGVTASVGSVPKIGIAIPVGGARIGLPSLMHSRAGGAAFTRKIQNG